MDRQNLIKKLCHYLNALVADNRSGSEPKLPKDEIFLHNLEVNIETALSELSQSPFHYETVKSYYKELPENASATERYWNFVLICLILIKGLSEALLCEEEGKREAARLDCTVLPAVQSAQLLSVSQQHTFKRCLQFVVALGILPNLTLGIRSILKKQTDVFNGIGNVESHSYSRVNYYRLVCTMSTLLECLKDDCLQNLILKHHAAVVLSALFQLCYGPVKGLTRNEHPLLCKRTPVLCPGPELLEKRLFEYKDFNQMLTKVKVCSGMSKEEFLKDMMIDRTYFTYFLQDVMKQMCPPVLMWELLLLQGTCLTKQNAPSCEAQKIPVWFKELCHSVMTDKLLESSGVKTFIQAAFDHISDEDVQSVSKQRIEAVAQLVVHNPVKQDDSKSYVEHILNQVRELLHMQESPACGIMKSTASSIVLQFAEQNHKSTKACIFRTFFEPFQLCLADNLLVFNDEKIASEQDITACIEDAYEIFIASSHMLREEHLRLLLPFYHLLFLMFCKLQSGISFLKARSQDLLVAVLKGCDNALGLLRAVAFEDDVVPQIQLARHIKCTFGDAGGIEIVRCTTESHFDSADSTDLKCQAILKLLHEVADKKLNVSFFLFLMKKSALINEASQENETKAFFDILITLNLLENLSEVIGDDLISNLHEAIAIIKDTLECAVKKPDQQFSEETIATCVLILSTLCGYKDQLISSHWKEIETCLPFLENLGSTHKLKSMAEDICAVIRTHGAASNSGNLSSSSPSEVSSESTRIGKKTIEDCDIVNGEASSNSEHEATTNKSFSAQAAVGDKRNQKSQSLHKEVKINSSSHATEAETKLPTSYELAVRDAEERDVPARASGLMYLSRLLEQRDAETISHRKELLELFHINLMDDDSYIYLSAIRGLTVLADISAEDVLPLLLQEFRNHKVEKWDQTVKIGEALLKICQKLNELTPKYRDQLISTYLSCTRHEDPHVRASSLSNLGEVCKHLKFSIGTWLQEVLLCVVSLLKSDSHIEVRRSAVMVIRLIFQGAKEDSFTILEDEIKNLYSLLKFTFNYEKDDVLKLQAQLALEEINHLVKESFQRKPCLTKEIKIINPF